MSVQEAVRREQFIVVACVAALIGLAWYYTLQLGHGMDLESGMSTPMPMSHWPADGVTIVVAMWMAMMVGMMLPAAVPMLLAFTACAHPSGRNRFALTSPLVFLLGYLLVWGAFSAVAAIGQLALQWAGVLTAEVRFASNLLGGGVLIAAGIYQATPLKHACLARCQSPFAFLLEQWCDGLLGGFLMGLKHGAYCLGCCWMLMMLLFAAGAMNLLWMVLVAAFVLVEKLVPGRRISHVSCLVLVALGLSMLVRGW